MTPEMTISQTLLAQPEIFSTLVAALQKTDLFDKLDKEGDYTLLAPTNEGFALTLAPINTTPEQLLGNTEILNQVLHYHLLTRATPLAEILSVSELLPESGGAIAVTKVDQSVVLNGEAGIKTPDLKCTNGIIQVIDHVLLPQITMPLKLGSAESLEEPMQAVTI